MSTIDFTPFFRSSIGFDSLISMLDSALDNDNTSSGYPPYNIEVTGENSYSIILAVAGFKEKEIDIQVKQNLLTVRGKRSEESDQHNYLYKSIAARNFERKFNLAEYVEVTEAKLENGLLMINLVKTIPEAMQPRRIAINSVNSENAKLEHNENQQKNDQAA